MKAGPSTARRYPAIRGAKIAKIAMEEYTIESVIRGHHIYIKSIWHPILGEQLTLEREDGNSHDRHQTSQSFASTLTPQLIINVLTSALRTFVRRMRLINVG